MQSQTRAIFDSTELAIALSHFDLGVIESIREFRRGSSASPKVGIVAQKGKFLLKKRAPNKSDLDRILFVHDVLAEVVKAGFPAAAPSPTRDGRTTLLQLGESLYELFPFAPGHPYERSEEQAFEAGRVLAEFHRVTAHYPALLRAPGGDYHDAPGVRTGLCAAESTLQSHDSFSGDEAELATLIQALLSAYEHSAARVNALGYESWPERITHSDWHPGNLLFRNGKVLAVVDFDSVRRSRTAADLANGALQFSMVADDPDPAQWTAEPNELLLASFLSGYLSTGSIGPHECDALSPLMVESLIAECVHPIAATGKVGKFAGYRVLQMVRRKVAWLLNEGTRRLPELSS